MVLSVLWCVGLCLCLVGKQRDAPNNLGRDHTYDRRPSKVLSEEHVLLLLCACHFVCRISTLVLIVAKTIRGVATRLGRVYCGQDATGQPLLAHALMQVKTQGHLEMRSWRKANVLLLSMHMRIRG